MCGIIGNRGRLSSGICVCLLLMGNITALPVNMRESAPLFLEEDAPQPQPMASPAPSSGAASGPLRIRGSQEKLDPGEFLAQSGGRQIFKTEVAWSLPDALRTSALSNSKDATSRVVVMRGAGLNFVACLLLMALLIGVMVACLAGAEESSDLEAVLSKEKCEGTWAQTYAKTDEQGKPGFELLFHCNIIPADEFAHSNVTQDHITQCLLIAAQMLRQRPLQKWIETPSEAQEQFQASLKVVSGGLRGDPGASYGDTGATYGEAASPPVPASWGYPRTANREQDLSGPAWNNEQEYHPISAAPPPPAAAAPPQAEQPPPGQPSTNLAFRAPEWSGAPENAEEKIPGRQFMAAMKPPLPPTSHATQVLPPTSMAMQPPQTGAYHAQSAPAAPSRDSPREASAPQSRCGSAEVPASSASLVVRPSPDQGSLISSCRQIMADSDAKRRTPPASEKSLRMAKSHTPPASRKKLKGTTPPKASSPSPPTAVSLNFNDPTGNAREHASVIEREQRQFVRPDIDVASPGAPPHAMAADPDPKTPESASAVVSP